MTAPPPPAAGRRPATGVRLYIARGTPNSSRAEKNLSTAIHELDGAGRGLPVEVVDVFTEPKRAIKDGIIATPTLIGFCAGSRQILVGDLADSGKLQSFLDAVLAANPLAG